jgi:FSR family fosmidomycin resistance protein-like MFS transporter
MPDTRYRIPDTHHRHPPAWAYVLLFSAGHFCVDSYAGIVSPLLEEFKRAYGLGKDWQILLYISPVSVFGSFLQPVLGLLSDRVSRGLLAAASLVVATVFMSLSGLAPHPDVLSLLLLGGGLGVGMFHPAAAAEVGGIQPERANRAVSIFVVGGMVGLSLPGVLVPWVVAADGAVDLHRTYLLMPGGLVLGALLLAVTLSMPKERSRTAGGERSTLAGICHDFFVSREFASVRLLWYIALVRIFVVTVFQRYVPFLGEERGWSMQTYGQALSVIVFFLGFGSLVGGTVFERTRAKRLFALSTVLPVPFFMLFALWPAKASMASAGVAALFLGLATPLTIAWAQKLQPAKAGLVSGLMLGFAWGVSDLAVPLVGAAAECVGRPAMLAAVALLLLPAGYMVRWLPEEAGQAETGSGIPRGKSEAP